MSVRRTLFRGCPFSNRPRCTLSKSAVLTAASCEGVSETPPQLAAVSTALFDRVQRGLFEKGQPRNSVRLTLNHVLGNFMWNLHTSRFGEFTVFQPATTGAQDQTFSPQWITDASVGYRLRGLALTLGANNLLDTYPDTLITANQTRGIYLFSGQSPGGFNGRFVYLNATLDFDTFRPMARRRSNSSPAADRRPVIGGPGARPATARRDQFASRREE